MKGFLAILGMLVAFFALMWVIQGNDFFMYKFFAPKYENARHEVFENSQAYVDGKVTDLAKYRHDYLTEKDSLARVAIQEVVVHQYADFDIDKIKDAQLRSWLLEMRN